MIHRLLFIVGCLVISGNGLSFVGRPSLIKSMMSGRKQLGTTSLYANNLNSIIPPKDQQNAMVANSYLSYMKDQQPSDTLVSEVDKNVISASTNEKLLAYLQPNNLMSGDYDYFTNNPPNLCYRNCDGKQRTCYYRFVLEAYTAMGAACGNCPNVTSDCFANQCVTADGFEKAILTVNRQMPGPSIEACHHDRVIIDVMNKMSGKCVAVHWHGIHHKLARWNDGVPMVTQCPILEGNIFRYSFECDNEGTLFYHSHSGPQKNDGIVGILNCRVPKNEDPNGNIYDFDLPSHGMVIQDWHHLTADSLFPGLMRSSISQLPMTYLINGKGIYQNESGSILSNVPISQFNVTAGKTFVFRIVAGTCLACQFEITFEDHDFIIIGTDANYALPRTVKVLTMSPGERFTVAVRCNQPISAYWIHVRAVGLCAFTKAHQVAVLRYDGFFDDPPTPMPSYDDPKSSDPTLVRVSPVNSLCDPAKPDGHVCLVDLRSFYDIPYINIPQPHQRITIAIIFHIFTGLELFNNSAYHTFLQPPGRPVSSGINGITNKVPTSPLVSQYEEIPSNIFCDPNGYPYSTWNQHRECVNVMPVSKNIVLEIVLCDTAEPQINGLRHPFHLHVLEFTVVAEGVFPAGQPFNISLRNLLNTLQARTTPYMPNPVKKDTVAIPSGGYMVLRLLTDIIGFCFFHCHFTYHLDSGMSGVLQVGDIGEFPVAPRDLPRCNDYLPLDFY